MLNMKEITIKLVSKTAKPKKRQAARKNCRKLNDHRLSTASTIKREVMGKSMSVLC